MSRCAMPPKARHFYDKKRAQRNGIVAIRAIAHESYRAVYFMLRNQPLFDTRRLAAQCVWRAGVNP